MTFSGMAACWMAASLLAASVEHDPYTGAVEVLRLSFENDEDRDFDGLPDDWSRRKGPGFPSYVETEIDRTSAVHGKQSLLFRVNGGEAIMYSPPVLIDSLHSFVFQGFVRTQKLKNDAAIISVSFLNHKRQRVQRFLSQPVSGTNADWVRVRVGPMVPRDDVRFVVLGCHLVHGNKMDIDGSCWFDDLWLGRLPRLSLVSNFQTHFKTRTAPVEIEAKASGLDPGHTYSLQLQMLDSAGELLDQTIIALDADKVEETADAEVPVERESSIWKLSPKNYGFYQIAATLQRDNVDVLEKASTFVVTDLVENRQRGEFGWAISNMPEAIPLGEFADVTGQAGINWLKIPLWKTVSTGDQRRTTEIATLFDKLTRGDITTIGLLNNPPKELRDKFARDWMGFREIFALPPTFWSPSLDPVIARYSSSVRHWQLGGDSDVSFVGMRRLGKTLSIVKQEFDRIGRDTQIGVRWDWNTEIPTKRELPNTFLSIDSDPPPSDDELITKLAASSGSGVPRWVLLKPLPAVGHTPQERSADLVRKMVAAKIGEAEGIFARDVFHSEHGLLNPDGSPTVMYLPWRTVALALQGAEHLGSFKLPGGSTNHAFARDGKVVLFLWNKEETIEEIYLGEGVVMTDVWGREIPIEEVEGTTRQRLQIGPVPRLVHGCNEAIARWRLGVKFAKGRVGSTTGGHPDAVVGRNTFPQGISGTITLRIPPDANGRTEWEVDPKSWSLQSAVGEPFNLPMVLTLPPNVKLGTEQWWLDFELAADRPYKFRVMRPFQVGLGDILIEVIDRRLENGRLEIEQIITNDTEPLEILNFSCSLFVPGQRRQKQFVTKLGKGQDRKFYYLPNADELRGQELWLRAEQVGGRRVFNYRWTVGERWDLEAAKADEADATAP